MSNAALRSDDAVRLPSYGARQTNSIAPVPHFVTKTLSQLGSGLGHDPVRGNEFGPRLGADQAGARPDWGSSAVEETSSERVSQQPSPSESMRRQIDEAAESSEIVDALRLRRDLCDFAEEVDQLIRRLADEPDEPQADTKSLKLLARAVSADHRLRTPHVLALDEEGHAHAEWHMGRAKLFATFRPTGHVKVVVVHPDTGEDPLRVAGTLYSTHTESFAKWLASSLPW